MMREQHPGDRWQEAARQGRGVNRAEQTRLRLAAMAGHMKGDMVAARRGALIDVLVDGRPHTREALWQAVEAQLVRECWGTRPDETLWRDMKALRAGGLRIAYSRRPGSEGYYLQYPPIEQPSSRRLEPSNPRHLEGIRGMTVAQKNRQSFSAAAFALRQKRLLLAREHPEWDEVQVDAAARRLVYGRHEAP